METRVRFLLGLCGVVLCAYPASARDHKHDRDRREHAPCPPPPPSPPVPETHFDVSLLSVDVGSGSTPAVSRALAGTSNRGEQIAALREQAAGGVSIYRVAAGPTLRVKQGESAVRENDQDSVTKLPGSPVLPALRSRVITHPHLNVRCAEVIDLSVEQAPVGASWTGVGAASSLTFENGDTKLLSETVHPDGTRHLLYATVFFPEAISAPPR